MNEAMAEARFRPSDPSTEHADGVVEAAEAVDELLLVGIRHLAVGSGGNLVGLQAQVGGELLRQPAERLDALGEDHEAVGCVLGVPMERAVL